MLRAEVSNRAAVSGILILLDALAVTQQPPEHDFVLDVIHQLVAESLRAVERALEVSLRQVRQALIVSAYGAGDSGERLESWQADRIAFVITAPLEAESAEYVVRQLRSAGARDLKAMEFTGTLPRCPQQLLDAPGIWM